MKIVLIIIGMALVTYLPRVLPLTVLREEALPPWARRGLTYVPIAVLSAIVGVAYIPSTAWFSFTLDGRLIAGLAAILVAAWTRSTALTIVVGMGVLILLR